MSFCNHLPLVQVKVPKLYGLMELLGTSLNFWGPSLYVHYYSSHFPKPKDIMLGPKKISHWAKKKSNKDSKSWNSHIRKKSITMWADWLETKPVNPKGNQPWIFIGRIVAEAEAPILWPPGAKSQLTGKDPDAGKDWGQEEKGTTEDDMVGCHHRLNAHEFEQTSGDGEGQGSLVYCSPWGHKESEMTEDWTVTTNVGWWMWTRFTVVIISWSICVCVYIYIGLLCCTPETNAMLIISPLKRNIGLKK